MSDKLYCELLYFVELMLEDDQGRLAIRDFFISSSLHNPSEVPALAPAADAKPQFLIPPVVEFDLARVLLEVSSPSAGLSADYSARVLGFFRRLFDLALEGEEEEEESGGGKRKRKKRSLHRVLRRPVASLVDRDVEVIRKWIKFLVQGESLFF